VPDQNAVNSALIAGRADTFTADSPVVDYQVKITNGAVEQGGTAPDVAPYGIAAPRRPGGSRTRSRRRFRSWLMAARTARSWTPGA